MKAPAICIMVVLVCLSVLPVRGQTPRDVGKASSEKLSTEVCQAMDRYVAKIDAAKSEADPSERSRKYDEAKAELESVLKAQNKTSLLTDAVLYATYTEDVASKDAVDQKLTEALEKRSKLREKLLQMCMNYTKTR